jgi:hypothetical protein
MHKKTEKKNEYSSIFTLLSVFFFFSPYVLYSQETVRRFIERITGLVNLGTGLFFAAAFVGFMWLGLQYMINASSSHRGEYAKQLAWGVLVLFILFSVWGIILFLASILQ